MMTQKKLVNIGACRNKKNKSRVGGVVLLFEAWLQYCRDQNINTTTIDTNKANYSNILVAYFSILYQFLKAIKGNTIVMLHGTAKDYLYLGPVVVFVSKLFGKKIILRKFAGNFEEIYTASNGFKRSVYNYVLRHSDIQFWETKSLVAFGQKKGSMSLWFPNVRKRHNVQRQFNKPYSRRFVYLSRVEKTKGLDVLMRCFDSLPDNYHVDIYGPISDYTVSELNGRNYSYKHPVEPDKVADTLAQYDVLVLPTLWKAEGYPGVVIECYDVGIPVIASRIGAIPEIVEDGMTGYLVESGDVEDLRRAILRINEDNYNKLASNAKAAFGAFEAQHINNNVLNIVMS